MSKYRDGLPEPMMAGEMWSREICDRLDEVITLLKGQTATLVGDRAKTVQVELSEPAPQKEEDAKEKEEPKKEETKAPARTAATTRSTTSAKKT